MYVLHFLPMFQLDHCYMETTNWKTPNGFVKPTGWNISEKVSD